MTEFRTALPTYYTPSLPPRRWGESEVAYRNRIMEFQAPFHRTEAGIRQLIDETSGLDAQTLEQQKAIQEQRLQELASFLSSEENRKFNQSIPEIAESAQAQGFLQTSGFGNALARERARLAGDTSARLTEQGIADRDFEVGALGATTARTNSLLSGGLERKFSLEDLDRSEALSRELARLGVQAPQSQSKNFLDQYGGLLGAGIGAVGSYYGGPGYAAVVNQQTQQGKTSSSPTYLCSHMEKLGLLTHKQVRQIHKKIYPILHNHIEDKKLYDQIAPDFIKRAINFDWGKIKTELYDKTMQIADSEKAFEHYKNVCIKLFYGSLVLSEK